MLDFGFYNMDCVEGMKEFPDKYFELAIVDPPYGDAGGVRQIPRDGFHGKVYGATSPGLAERGRRNSEKNYFVGRGAGKGIF